MAEFEEKLNALLSNPDAMAQIMQMAQSLGASQASADSASASGENRQEKGGSPPASSPSPSGSQSAHTSFPPKDTPRESSPPVSGDLLSSLTSGVDPKLLLKLLPLIQELGSGQNSNARALLMALRPYLKPERQEKVERALQLARLFHLGKKFLAGWEG